MNMYHNRGGEKKRSRHIAIFVDGACSGNGQRWARAGMGVFFGPRSRHNISQRLHDDPQTNQRAELHAAILALDRVKELLDDDKLETRLVVVATDSAYLVDGITKWIYKWQDNGWTNARGGDVANREDFETLDELIDELEDDYGVFVKFWKVDRDDNEDADELAREAVD
jgi:ribonuclease HI